MSTIDTIDIVDAPSTAGLRTDDPIEAPLPDRLAAVERVGYGPEPCDAALLDAVRRGDQRAFEVLFRRHRAAVERLSRRLARSAADADDIVSEVFAATLRATLAGRGPTDDALPYLLRSVRNTATSISTRGDGARTQPLGHRTLDRLAPTVAHEYRDHDEALTDAFLDLPERFRSVLWSTEVDGVTPAELTTDTTDAGAVASLSHRARRALRRSYLSTSTRRRCTDAGCRSTRSAMPGVVMGDAADSTATRVRRHIDACAECAAVFDQMETLARQMPTRSLLAAVLAFVRNIGGVTASLAGGVAPAVVVPVAVATLTAGAIVTADLVTTERVADERRVAAGRIIDVPDPDDASGLAAARADVEPAPVAPGRGPSAARRENDEPSTVAGAPGAAIAETPPPGPAGAKSTARPATVDPADGVGSDGPTTDPVDRIDDASGPADHDGPVGTNAPATPLSGTVGALGETVDEVVGTLGTTVHETVDTLGTTVDEVVTTTANGIDDALEPITSTVDHTVGELTATVDTVTEPVVGAIEPVLDPVVEPVVELATSVEPIGELTGGLLGSDDTETNRTDTNQLVDLPATTELVDETTDLVVDVGDGATDGVSDLVGRLLGR